VLSSTTHDDIVFLALTGPSPHSKLAGLSVQLEKDGIRPSRVRVVLLPNNFHALPTAPSYWDRCRVRTRVTRVNRRAA
jgi:hypothetical protein